MSDKNKNWILAIVIAFITSSAFADCHTHQFFSNFEADSNGFVVTSDRQRLGAVLADSIKMSKSKVCHTLDSHDYMNISNYIAFPTLENCLDAGGSLPNIGE